MSIRPGVTCSPPTFTVFDASFGSILAATAAIFPSLIATSRNALIPFLASITCPPCNSRSYLGCAKAQTQTDASRNNSFMAPLPRKIDYRVTLQFRQRELRRVRVDRVIQQLFTGTPR